ncbi:crossover junction endodeoxyribonuclease RuvA [Microterricola viridarii]|uniref:Putative pre-16S rRNA nuclease n=1 Tax=Microterricola viridarii TaxID=412690 RepID=A0A0X8E1N7_9MICO|nr:crossover junction endodeoxyribonuclease RuvA [Microterricola viridarii]
MRLGVDVGKARVGLSRSDLHGMLATPVETVPRSLGEAGTGSTPDAAPTPDLLRIAAVQAELDAIEVVVGLPLALSGAETASTADAKHFATELARALPVPVRLVDERLSTVSATSALRASGKKAKSHRPVIDQVAAVIILQHALDSERGTGNAPGTTLSPNEGL